MPYVDEVLTKEQEVWMSVRERLRFDLPPDPFTIPCRLSVLVNVAAVLCESVSWTGRIGQEVVKRYRRKLPTARVGSH